MASNGTRNSIDTLLTLREETSSAVQAFASIAQKYEHDLTKSTTRYKALLENYHVLQHELDALKAAPDVYSADTLADPYVIVLIDAHSHRFRNDLLEQGTNGGSMTAKQLREAIEHYIEGTVPDLSSYRVVVRVYANLKRLLLRVDEKALHALACFAAGFSREDSFCDFVDVGHETVVRPKIRDLFDVSVKDPQCRHVFLGAVGDPTYHMLSQAHFSFPGKMAYVRGSTADNGMLQSGVKNTLVSQAFATFKSEHLAAVQALTGIPGKILESGACLAFQKDECFQKDCKFKHIVDWAMSVDTAAGSLTKSTPPIHTDPANLPLSFVEGMVPVNAADQRLDIYMAPPSEAQWAAYTARLNAKKLCNDFHLQGNCRKSACEFDHGHIDKSTRKCLEFIVKSMPCRHRGACRHLDCDVGHVCQSVACQKGKVKKCKLPHNLHGVDLRVDKWVQPTKVHRDIANAQGERVASTAESSVGAGEWRVNGADSSTGGQEIKDVVESRSETIVNLIDL